jgi:hypothetical protein
MQCSHCSVQCCPTCWLPLPRLPDPTSVVSTERHTTTEEGTSNWGHHTLTTSHLSRLTQPAQTHQHEFGIKSTIHPRFIQGHRARTPHPHPASCNTCDRNLICFFSVVHGDSLVRGENGRMNPGVAVVVHGMGCSAPNQPARSLRSPNPADAPLHPFMPKSNISHLHLTCTLH